MAEQKALGAKAEPVPLRPNEPERRPEPMTGITPTITTALPSSPAPVIDTTPTSTDTATPSTPPQMPEAGTPEKPQLDPSRCWSCNKKVGLLGFKCKCYYVFCSRHRYSDKHECSFDYQQAAKTTLAKENPMVVAHKIDKL